MREPRTRAELEALFLMSVNQHQDCAGVAFWGRVYRLERTTPDAPSWGFACRFDRRTLRDLTKCDDAARAIVADLQSRYDLAP